MKVFVRADAGPEIGDGHLMRCFALACALSEQGADVTLLSAPGQSQSRALWQKHFTVSDWPHSADLIAEEAGLLACLDAAQPSVLIIDSYAFDAASLAEICQKTRCVFFNDLGDVDAPVALVINQNAGGENFAPDYSRAKTMALGPAYACLRPEIVAQKQQERQGILISFGNAQPDGLSQSVVQDLLAQKVESPLTVVAPEHINISAGAQITRLAPCDLAPLLARARSAIIGGGVTALEAAYLGTPAIILPIADNQRPGARALHTAGVALCAGTARASAEKMAALIETPRALEQMSLNARRLVDGQGPSQLATLISSL